MQRIHKDFARPCEGQILTGIEFFLETKLRVHPFESRISVYGT